MRGALAVAAVLLSIGAAWAATSAQIRCALFSSGGGSAVSANHAIRGILGQPLVTAATSAQYRLLPGGIGCAVPTVSAVSPGTAVPAVLQLHGNTPNPFNPSTTIVYEVPRASQRVTLRIYDISGRLIRVLRDGPEPAGRREVTWDGRDDAGNATAASGMYVYQLESDGHRLTRKMTLLK